MKTKQCKDCKELKNQSEFYGVQGECKNCTQKRVHKNYLLNREHYIKYEIKRNKNPKRKEQKAKYLINYRLKNKQKNTARGKIHSALRNGSIKREDCVVCKNPKTEAHHPDHSKPLEVMWLCRKHHIEIENKIPYEKES